MLHTINHVPEVQSLELEKGSLTLPNALLISISDEIFSNTAAFLADYLSPLNLSFTIGLADQLPSANILFIRDSSLESEAYQLHISTRDIKIVASDASGAFYALQTIRQLLPHPSKSLQAVELPCLRIKDCPRFSYRGMHLDVSRHFFDLDFIKKYIDLLAFHKMNKFHWHLTDDAGWRIEIKRYPRLVEVGSVRAGTVTGFTLDVGAKSDETVHGGFYTQQDIKDVVAYAAERHISIVPEIDIPGHASALLVAYPELGCSDSAPANEVKVFFGNFEQVLCPTESCFEFLANVFKEVADLFPGPYIHIGGDEVKTTHWQHCAQCKSLMQQNGFKATRQLQSYFIKRVGAIVSDLGKTAIAWDDVVDDQIDSSMTIMSWLCKDQATYAASAGHNLIMTPMSHVYFDFYQSHCLDEPAAIHGLTRLQDVYQFDPLAELEDSDLHHRVLGAQGNLWTEYVKDPTNAERMVLPRMSALAEVLWTDKSRQSWGDFCRRLPAFESRLRGLGYEVANSHYKPHLSAEQTSPGRFLVSIQSLSQALVYTLDGSDPTANSTSYQQPFVVDSTTKVRATSVLKDQQTLGQAQLSLVVHLGLGQSVTFASLTDKESAIAEQRLLNGQLSHDRIFDHPQWVAFDGIDMDAIISFDKPTLVSEVRLGFDAGAHRKLHSPSGLSIMLPDSEGEWRLIAAIHQQQIDQCDRVINLKFSPEKVLSLRVIAHNDQTAWSPELAAMTPVILYLDELVVL